MAAVARTRRAGIERWAGLGGVLYVVLFIGGVLLAFSGTPDGDAPPAEYVQFFGDSGNRDQIEVGWCLVVLGVFFFIWFLAALRRFVGDIDGDGFLTFLVTFGGATYATLTLAGMSVVTGISTMSDDTFRHQVDPAVIHAGGDAGYVIHASGGVGAAAMMIATTLAVRRAALIPGWLGVVGVVVGVLAIGSIFFVPMFLIALWILVAGVLLLRRANVPGAPVEGTPGTGAT